MSTSHVIWPAPAKLNLFLHITSRRKDGYHCLQTIFQFLDYCDILHFQLRKDGQLSCKSTLKDLEPEQDLTLKAANLLKQYSNTSLGVDIQVEKKIPVGGGLGGGSSDAATALLALNKIWQLDLSLDVLAQLGLKLGADIPVFIYGRAAWAEGIGELLTPIELEEPWYLVVHPGCHVSTAKIFNAKDLTRNSFPIIMQDFVAGKSTNVCEAVVCKLYPSVAEAIDWLNKLSPTRMTGTGACLFAKFENNSQADAVLKQLPDKWQGFIAQGKNISPVHFSNMKTIL
ncbi:4-(cytidine 5'-diphospho)-2-C-methyl-D-erythritol kinase [Candidatus Halobeggiatoa sp. HSG11]|nr:4-(cytidine 5'-diphospho)-2-C-methyl-D-erythritol kinase [Candidatus Halobeggiatoa sp. HSG11]